MMRDMKSKREDVIVKKEEYYRVPVFPIDVPPPPPPPGFLAGKDGGKVIDVTWEVDGNILGHDHEHEHGLLQQHNTKGSFTSTSCVPFQVKDDQYYYYSDLLLKTETTSSVYNNYGEEEQEEEDDDDDDDINGIRSCTSSLKLSLNYDKVLDAWSNRGSLWADISCNTTADADAATCYMGEVPVLMDMDMNMNILEAAELVGGDEKRCGRREASVLRYKEKRHSRLFSKKIRYQVRKLNADQRPRLKGRFVKRSLEKKIFI